MGKSITQFCREILDPAIYERADRVFPEMEFKPHKNSGGWESRKKLDLTDGKRQDKSVITPRYQNRIKEQGGESKDLITFYKELNNLPSDIEAILAICKLIGITPPTPEDSAKYEAYAKRREALEAINAKMRKALYSPEGKDTLDYLRNVRGYSDDFIEYAELGYCSEAIAKELAPLMEYVDKNGDRHSIHYQIGARFVLSFPFRTNGRLNGFNFRVLDPNEKDKYRNAFISHDATKKYNLFGLTQLKPIGATEWNKSIVIVEGELDALRAQFAGLTNVVACTGGEIYPEALQEAKTQGAKDVTLLFDTEKTEEGQRETQAKILKAINTIRAEGLTPHVAFFPVEKEGEKVDTDSYLKTHKNEELKNVINEALKGSIWQYINLADEYRRKYDEANYAGYVLEEYKRRTIEFCNDSRIVSPTDRDLIFDLFLKNTGRLITKEAIAEEADRQRAIADSARQKNETITLLSESYALANNPQDPEGTAKALAKLSEKVDELRQITASLNFDKYLLTPTGHGLREDYATAPEGIATSYAFGFPPRQQRLILQGGALTYICAPTSHGKTTFFVNLALDAVKAPGSGAVLYFTYEEPLKDLKLRFLNTLIGGDVSQGNTTSLKTYFRTGEVKYFSGSSYPRSLKGAEDKLEFLLREGRLRLFRERADSRELMDIIRYIHRNIKVKAVFIDYIQLLHTDGYKGDRKNELGRICEDFIELATETELPIVIASQLNRETKSPIEMDAQNIAEASNIEHSANTIVMLWNSNTAPREGSRYYETKRQGSDSIKVESEDAKKIGRGFTPGIPGKIYAKLTKNRDGERNIDAVFDYHGNSGKITQPDYTPPKDGERSGDLFSQEQPTGAPTSSTGDAGSQIYMPF